MSSRPSTATAVIELDAASRSYGERVALDGLSLRVEDGQTLGVVGPNGAGKSTLLRILATLLRPQAGTVRVLGRELPGEAHAVRGLYVADASLFPSASGVNPMISVAALAHYVAQRLT